MMHRNYDETHLNIVRLSVCIKITNNRFESFLCIIIIIIVSKNCDVDFTLYLHELEQRFILISVCNDSSANNWMLENVSFTHVYLIV